MLTGVSGSSYLAVAIVEVLLRRKVLRGDRPLISPCRDSYLDRGIHLQPHYRLSPEFKHDPTGTMAKASDTNPPRLSSRGATAGRFAGLSSRSILAMAAAASLVLVGVGVTGLYVEYPTPFRSFGPYVDGGSNQYADWAWYVLAVPNCSLVNVSWTVEGGEAANFTVAWLNPPASSHSVSLACPQAAPPVSPCTTECAPNGTNICEQVGWGGTCSFLANSAPEAGSTPESAVFTVGPSITPRPSTESVVFFVTYLPQ